MSGDWDEITSTMLATRSQKLAENITRANILQRLFWAKEPEPVKSSHLEEIHVPEGSTLPDIVQLFDLVPEAFRAEATLRTNWVYDDAEIVISYRRPETEAEFDERHREWAERRAKALAG